jgi:putative peptide maturation dehydrogenase
MRRARRAAHIFVRLSDDLLPDIERLLRGEVELVRETRLVAVSVLTGRECPVSLDELRLLQALPSDRWTDIADLGLQGAPVEENTLHRLALAGLIVSDAQEQPLAALRRWEEQLTATGWDPYAALYHSRSRWRDVDVGDVAETAPAQRAAHPDPPRAFSARSTASEVLELPLVRPSDGFFHRLLERRTTRGFDRESALTRGELAILLDYSFGCHGFARLEDGITLLKKTSPSGGSLHAIEAYPLVLDVVGVSPGLYHYRADRHALELVSALDPEAARDLLLEFTAGQSYLSSAKVLLIMTARFVRSFWKYRDPRAYSVLLMDAAHISQTLYLLSAELGLGAFVSAAVNAANIEERLGLDTFQEGVLAACGFGRPAPQRSPFDLDFEPYVPRETVIE